jgi:hypothetical protein
MSLTPKQENFAQCVAKGMTQSDAYRTAYNVSPDTKNESINVNASKLMADTNISQRVAELKEQISAKSLWTREMSVKALAKAYKIAEQRENSSGMTGAIKELNVMHGYNAPQKLDLSNSDGSLRSQGMDFSKLSSAALAELLALKDASERE